MRARSIVIGTRGSSLALCQAQIVQVRLEERWPRHEFTVQTIVSRADRKPDVPLASFSGEGVFVKELEEALRRGEIDLAVHSLKDLPLDLPEGLRLAAVSEREDPRDALVARGNMRFGELPEGARVGTSSLRRRSQLQYARPDLKFLDLRGNVDTRLRKLTEGRYEAIVVAACGLIRLGMEERITEYLDFDVILPEPGQGALAIEIRADDAELRQLVDPLNDPITRTCVEVERAFLGCLGGGCRIPIAAYAEEHRGVVTLHGVVSSPDGANRLRGDEKGSMLETSELGAKLAERLIARGALDLLKAVDT